MRIALVSSTAAFVVAAALAPTWGWASTAEERAQLRAALEAPFDGRSSAALEQAVASASHGRARREGKVLRLLLSGGRRLALQNNPCEDQQGNLLDDCHRYILAADLPSLHAYLVLDGHYEGGDAILVDDRTGRRTVLDAVPTFSPDGTEFLTIDDDVGYGTDPEFEIWRRKGDTASVVWSGQAEGLDLHYSTGVRWTAQGRIALTMHAYAPKGRSGPSWPAMLTRDGKAWRIQMDPPQAAKAQ